MRAVVQLTRRLFLIRIAMLAVAARLSAAPRDQLDLSKLLRAIAEVETGNDDSVVGPVSERSRYQISQIVWRQYRPKMPFTRCRGVEATAVGLEHLQWLSRHLPSESLRERYEREYVLAWCWHGGLSSWGKSSARLSRYAARVQNLYLVP